VLADLHPATILVDRQGNASWAPLLLTAWPPAPQFWPTGDLEQAPGELVQRLFPIVPNALLEDNVFVAPEVLEGIYDERSDVYSLGAILYLLLTGYAPVAAARRLWAVAEEGAYVEGDQSETGPKGEIEQDGREEALELMAPQILNEKISIALGEVVMIALELDAERRYTSAFELVEALELAAETCFGKRSVR
jgi:serine/threonine protein kinase